MAVVTITRQYGAGGSRVAQLAAQALGWSLIDNEFVSAVASRAGVPAEEVAAHEERVPSLLERVGRALASASPEIFVPAAIPGVEPDEEKLVRQAERVIAEAAREGRAVLVGRGAQAFLATARPEQALHAWVVATREVRLRVVMERLNLDAAAAESRMDHTDLDRDRYVDRWYGRRRQDPANYHLVLNTAWLGYDGAAELIVAEAKRRGWV
jgi:cytidylate kinase